MGVGDPIARQTKLNMGGSDPHVSQRLVLGDVPTSVIGPLTWPKSEVAQIQDLGQPWIWATRG